mmetsp:Transcript_14770/g.51441  ORF Transcript_14770/g.51441 Transcript_14770/m.51441 type:complete len:205 (+) Transcript_14770:1576-2190(+)
MSLNPPPVVIPAPYAMLAGTSATWPPMVPFCVAPTDRTYGDVAGHDGKNWVQLSATSPVDKYEPVSPEDTTTVTPNEPRIWKSWLPSLMAACVGSSPPYEMEMTCGGASANCTASSVSISGSMDEPPTLKYPPCHTVVSAPAAIADIHSTSRVVSPPGFDWSRETEWGPLRPAASRKEAIADVACSSPCHDTADTSEAGSCASW